MPCRINIPRYRVLSDYYFSSEDPGNGVPRGAIVVQQSTGGGFISVTYPEGRNPRTTWPYYPEELEEL